MNLQITAAVVFETKSGTIAVGYNTPVSLPKPAGVDVRIASSLKDQGVQELKTIIRVPARIPVLVMTDPDFGDLRVVPLNQQNSKLFFLGIQAEMELESEESPAWVDALYSKVMNDLDPETSMLRKLLVDLFSGSKLTAAFENWATASKLLLQILVSYDLEAVAAEINTLADEHIQSVAETNE